MLCGLSRKEFQKLYDRMDIKLNEVGESFYNPRLAPMVKELREAKFAVEDQGAMCIFVGGKKAKDDGKKGKDGKPVKVKQGPPPLMVQKSDGGFGYAATDMAAIRYRS